MQSLHLSLFPLHPHSTLSPFPSLLSSIVKNQCLGLGVVAYICDSSNWKLREEDHHELEANLEDVMKLSQKPKACGPSANSFDLVVCRATLGSTVV